MGNRSWAFGASAAALICAIGGTAATAQGVTPLSDTSKTAPAVQASSGDLAEVVVTARRSSEKLQDVPLAITAATADQLLSRQINDLQSLAKYVPGFSFRDFVTGFHGNPTIRGLSQINTSSPVTNVGVFVDGVYLQRDYQLNQSLGDYDRIEVVKGPQSALYGANTFAGAVNYVTKRPTDEFSANGQASLGNAGYQRFEAGVGGPIVKGVLDGRLYVGSDKYEGTITNNLPGVSGSDKHFDSHDRSAYSAALKFTPTSFLVFDAYYSHTEKKEGVKPYYTVSGAFKEDRTNCGTVVPVTGRPGLFCGTFATDPAQYRTGVGAPTPGLYSNVQPDSLGTNDLFRLGAEWVISPSLTLHYTLGMTRGGASEDFAFFSNNYNPSLGSTTSNSFSQQIEGGQIHYTSHELRLNYDAGGPLKAEIGYFRSDADDRYFLGIRSQAITGAALGPLIRYSDSPLYVPPGTIALNNLHETFGVDAFFGRASYSFLDDRATVSAELRYTITDLVYDDISARKTVPSRPLLTSSYKDPTPRFTAEYKLSRDNMVYASAAEGIKTGGFNGYVSGTLTLLPQEQAYGEEKNWTYEVGSKNSFLNHSLILNADFFYVDWSKKLGSVSPTNAPVSQGNTTVANIYQATGSATNYGIEVDGLYRPIHPLSITFSFAAQHPTYDQGSKNLAFVGYCSASTCPIDGTISGNVLERTSELSGAVGAEYRDHFREGWDYFAGLDLTYQSLQYSDQENLGKIAPFTLLNGRIGFENDRWSAFVWAKNLADQIYVDNAFYIQNQRQFTASLGERRTFGITLAGKF